MISQVFHFEEWAQCSLHSDLPNSLFHIDHLFAKIQSTLVEGGILNYWDHWLTYDLEMFDNKWLQHDSTA